MDIEKTKLLFFFYFAPASVLSKSTCRCYMSMCVSGPNRCPLIIIFNFTTIFFGPPGWGWGGGAEFGCILLIVEGKSWMIFHSI